MAKSVLLTLSARAELETILIYLLENWGISITTNFMELYDAKIAIISTYPKRYPVLYPHKELRKAVLTKYNIILYTEKEDHIEIISVFDTRQYPTKIAII